MRIFIVAVVVSAVLGCSSQKQNDRPSASLTQPSSGSGGSAGTVAEPERAFDAVTTARRLKAMPPAALPRPDARTPDIAAMPEAQLAELLADDPALAQSLLEAATAAEATAEMPADQP